MDSSASDGAVFVLLHVITCLVLFLVSSVYADHSPALPTPYQCFYDESTVCVLSVAYPLENPSYIGCGYPGFAVDCNDESGMEPFINISNHIYLVLGVDYKFKTITLMDDDVEGSGCPQPKRNFSFPSSPSWVNYRLSPYNITVFYNCSGVPADAEKHLLCSKQDTNTPPSYAFFHGESRAGFDWYGNCAQNVVVPIMFSGGNYREAIERGFWMTWSATDWCEDCERSGGRCWSIDNSTGCACKNDGNSYNRTCPRPRHQGLSTGLKIGIVGDLLRERRARIQTAFSPNF